MKILIPATSANLGPGFDVLGLALDFFNEVTINKSKLISVTINGEGQDRPRLKKNNIFISIFYDTLDFLKKERTNLSFDFQNNIPFSRGLGSSSSVVVGAISSAYYFAGLKPSRHVILNRALKYEKHPDNIAPAVYGGFCVSIVHNNHVYVKKKPIPKLIQAVVVIPKTPISTAVSRQKLPKKFSIYNTSSNIAHSSFLTAAFMSEDWDILKIASKDVMHESFRMEEMPELFKVREVALSNKSLMSTLSGSGPSFLNIVYEKDAYNLAKVLKNEFPNFQVSIFDFNNSGIKIIES